MLHARGADSISSCPPSKSRCTAPNEPEQVTLMSRNEDFLDALGRAAARSGAFSEQDSQDLLDALDHRRKARAGLVEPSSPFNAADAERVQASHRLHAHLEDAGWQMARGLSKHPRGASVLLGKRTLDRPKDSYDPDIPDRERFPTEEYTDMVSLTPNEDGSVHARLSQPHWDHAQEVDERANLRGVPHTSSDLSKFVAQYYRP